MSNIDRILERFSRLLPHLLDATDDPRWKDIRKKFNAEIAGRRVLADLLDDPEDAELRARFLFFMKIYIEDDVDFADAVELFFGSSQALSHSGGVLPPPPLWQSAQKIGDEFLKGKDDLFKKIVDASERGEKITSRRSPTRAVKNSDLQKTSDSARGIPKMDGGIAFELPSFEEPQSAPPEEKKEDVSFTTMYSRQVKPEKWNTMLFYVHLSGALDLVKKDAERFKDQIPESKDATVQASTPLARGTELSITPICDGVTFNPPRAAILWLEDLHRVEFRFRADQALSDDAAKGTIEVRVGPLIVGTLKLSFLVSDDAPEASAPEPEQAEMYHQDDIFISYSHKDTDVALAFKKAYDAIGHNVLIDIDTLRSGQEWNAELMKMIERAEIFQLFWSDNSSASKYCKQEWEHALSLKRSGFVRPCYWQKPMPTPPDELRHLHFEFVQM